MRALLDHDKFKHKKSQIGDDLKSTFRRDILLGLTFRPSGDNQLKHLLFICPHVGRRHLLPEKDNILTYE